LRAGVPPGGLPTPRPKRAPGHAATAAGRFSNLRGQSARPPAMDRDLWAETAADPPREVPPLGVARPDL